MAKYLIQVEERVAYDPIEVEAESFEEAAQMAVMKDLSTMTRSESLACALWGKNLETGKERLFDV